MLGLDNYKMCYMKYRFSVNIINFNSYFMLFDGVDDLFFYVVFSFLDFYWFIRNLIKIMVLDFLRRKRTDNHFIKL